MLLNQFLLLGAFLFCTGIYGVLTRKHAVLVLMSIELMLAGGEHQPRRVRCLPQHRRSARCSRCSC